MFAIGDTKRETELMLSGNIDTGTNAFDFITKYTPNTHTQTYRPCRHKHTHTHKHKHAHTMLACMLLKQKDKAMAYTKNKKRKD